MDSILRSKEESALATNGEIEKQKIGFEVFRLYDKYFIYSYATEQNT